MATIWRGEEGKGWEANGDPTEVSVHVAGDAKSL
jgi:hypothetical protein